MLMAHGQSLAADRASAQVSLFGLDQADASRPRLQRTEMWTQTERLDEELSAVGFYLSGHPLEDMMELLRRRRTLPLTDALAAAENGAEAFRMAGIVRRRQERAQASGQRFAFVSLSDPTGEYEVLFPPEVLAKCRDCLEPGKAVAITVRAKQRDGEVRFFGDSAVPIEQAADQITAGLRVFVSPGAVEMEALKARFSKAVIDKDSRRSGGEITLVAALSAGREVEIKLPGRYNLDAALRGALKTAPGVAYLEEA